MRSNFRPNIPLAKKILLFNVNLAIACKLSPIAKIYQKKNLFLKDLKHQIDIIRLIKKLRIVKQANPSIISESILKKK